MAYLLFLDILDIVALVAGQAFLDLVVHQAYQAIVDSLVFLANKVHLFILLVQLQLQQIYRLQAILMMPILCNLMVIFMYGKDHHGLM